MPILKVQNGQEITEPEQTTEHVFYFLVTTVSFSSQTCHVGEKSFVTSSQARREATVLK